MEKAGTHMYATDIMDGVETVSLVQTEKGTYRGTLKIAPADDSQELELPATIIHDKGERIWIRVQVKSAITDREERKRVSHQLASNALSIGSGWRYMAADSRDGEVLLSATLSYDLSSGAIDRFFDMGKSFLSENWIELSKLFDGPEQRPQSENEPRSGEHDWCDLI